MCTVRGVLAEGKSVFIILSLGGSVLVRRGVPRDDGSEYNIWELSVLKK